jgi:phospholipid/cholesterol/gamma-HCH transport system ATP-binding protein
MRRFKFGGGGGGSKDDQQSTPDPTSPAPGDGTSTPAPETPLPSGKDSEQWMAPEQEPFSGAPDEPAPIGSSSGGSGYFQPAAESAPGAPAASPAEPEPAAPTAEQPAAAQPAAAAPMPWDRESGSGPSDTPEPGRSTGVPPMPERTPEQKATAAEMTSRVSVVDEPAQRPAPPAGASEEEYKWHTYKHYPSGRPDAVEFIDTYKSFGRNRILRGLNMGLPEGMVSMVLGPSGTGKSVCIKHIVGLLYPDEGDILVHGESVPNMPDDDLFEMRKKFGLLFQDGALFGSMDLYDNVCFPLRQHTEKSEDEIEDIVMRRLNEVGLGAAREKYPNELSGGMRKRAGFARALVLEPDIVMFDEPDSGLDPVRTALLGELILEVHRDMMDEAQAKKKPHLPTFVVITHDIMSARRVADYINVLWKGRIVEAGPAEDMLNSENPFIRQFLSGESQGPLTMD